MKYIKTYEQRIRYNIPKDDISEGDYVLVVKHVNIK